METVQNLPKQHGGVGMVKKALFSCTARAVQEEKTVSSTVTHAVSDPKAQWYVHWVGLLPTTLHPYM